MNISPFPDAVCALAAIACFTEGTVVIEDAAVCRRKETDRLKVLNIELSRLGAEIEECEDSLVIHGHSPILKDGSPNPAFKLHGAVCESYDDHRMAMSFAILGLYTGNMVIKDYTCVDKTFPNFFAELKRITTPSEQ